MDNYDFSGWATRNDLKCSDGRTIMRDAFKECDGQVVPMVWNHDHDTPDAVLGHCLLKNEPDGVRTYGFFNDTESGVVAKALVSHGDIKGLSIYANKIKQQGTNVIHGIIREVSLVHAGANPGAFIDTVIAHSDDHDEEFILYTGEDISLFHSDEKVEEKTENKEDAKVADKEKTINDVFDTLTDEQKNAVYAIVGYITQNKDKEDEKVKHNVFDNDSNYEKDNVISHSEMMAVIADAKRYGTMRESAIAHGIDHIDYLFPDAQNVQNVPSFIQRDMGWVKKVMNAVHHTPFSRIKSIHADITEDDARARGYIKGNMKKEEFFSLLKRSTTPTTVYKKQKLDRDDVIDITDFDVIAWLKGEMRMLLDEELARALLLGDGRLASSDDKINEGNIRPVAFDDSVYTIQSTVAVGSTATDDDVAKAFIRKAIKERKNYKGSGNPTMYMTEDLLTDCLLLEDNNGRTLYEDEDKLARKLRVKEIVTVPPMENTKSKGGNTLLGIMVNLNDYNVGADKGGAVNLFDDFDIDYNAQKYLIETRCSGALTVPYSAIVFDLTKTA